MSDNPTYPELVEQVRFMQSKLAEMEAKYVWIRREPAISAPGSLDGGSAVLTSTGLYFGVGGAVVSTTLA